MLKAVMVTEVSGGFLLYECFIYPVHLSIPFVALQEFPTLCILNFTQSHSICRREAGVGGGVGWGGEDAMEQRNREKRERIQSG